jgi:hypothetical protein
VGSATEAAHGVKKVQQLLKSLGVAGIPEEVLSRRTLARFSFLSFSSWCERVEFGMPG